jgi:hypothetical protein
VTVAKLSDLGEMLREMKERGERQKAGEAGANPDGSKK